MVARLYMVCSGVLGLSGKDQCANFGTAWVTRAPNFNYGRSIGQNAGVGATVATDLNMSAVRSFAGSAYTGDAQSINMQIFYDNATPVFSWASKPTSVNEGNGVFFTVSAANVADGAMMYWHITPLTYCDNSYFTAVDGSMTVNNLQTSGSFAVYANGIPNQDLGSYNGIPILAARNGTFTLDIWYRFPYNNADGRKVLTTTITIVDSGGGSGTVTFTAPTGNLFNQLIRMPTQRYLPPGWTLTGDRYIGGAPNTVNVIIPNGAQIGGGSGAVTNPDAALRIIGCGTDNIYVTVDGVVYGKGGHGGGGGGNDAGYRGGTAISISSANSLTLNGTGHILGGGGGGGGDAYDGGSGGGGAGGGSGGTLNPSYYNGNTTWNSSGGAGSLLGSSIGVGGGGGSVYPSGSGGAGFSRNGTGASGGQGGRGGGAGGSGGLSVYSGAYVPNGTAGAGGGGTPGISGLAGSSSSNTTGAGGGGGGWGARGGAGGTYSGFGVSGGAGGLGGYAVLSGRSITTPPPYPTVYGVIA